MDPIHRKILRQRTKDITDAIFPTDGFMAELIQSGIFNEEMIEIIEAEKTRSRKVYKILEILPTRGPTAFQTFVSLLKTDYEWLHNDLQDDLEKEMAQQRKDNKMEKKQEEKEAHTSISHFLHMKFGQSRKLSEREKKAIEKWLSDYIKEAQVRWEKSFTEREQTDKKLTAEEVQQMFTRIEIINMNLESCFYDFDDKHVSSERWRIISKLTPEDAITHLDQNVNNLRQRLNNLTEERNECLTVLQSTQETDIPTISRSNTSSSFGTLGLENMPLLEEIKQLTHSYDIQIEKLKKENESLSLNLDTTETESKLENQELQEKNKEQNHKLSCFMKELLRLQQEIDTQKAVNEKKELTIARQTKTINSLKNHDQQKTRNRNVQTNPSGGTGQKYKKTEDKIKSEKTRKKDR